MRVHIQGIREIMNASAVLILIVVHEFQLYGENSFSSCLVILDWNEALIKYNLYK